MDEESPAIKDEESPAIKDEESPAIKDEESPAIKDEESPAIKDEESPANLSTDSGELPVLRLCDRTPQFGTEPGDGALLFGDSRKDLVAKSQSMLRDLQLNVGTTGPDNDGIDGKFGDLTRKAVKEFQSKNKAVDGSPLKQDGLIGPRTADALNRRVVGKQFDVYQTPIELTKEFLLVTTTDKALRDSINMQPVEGERIQIVINGAIARSLKFIIHDRIGEIMRDIEVEIRFSDGTSSLVRSNGEGVCAIEVEKEHEFVDLSYEAGKNDPIATRIFVDVKDINTEEGVSRRLHNLGYLVDEKDLEGAIGLFQSVQGLNPNRKIDKNTRDKLKTVHDGIDPFAPDIGEETGTISEKDMIGEGHPAESEQGS